MFPKKVVNFLSLTKSVMKKILILFLFASGIVEVYAQQAKQVSVAAAAPAKENGEAFMKDYFMQTYAGLERSVSGLTSEQLNFKPAADKWSINECLEHIVLTEKMLFEEAKKTMEAPASPKRRKDVKVRDEEIIKGISDRSHKVKAPAELTGKGKYSDAAQALAELEQSRKLVSNYLSTHPVADLRNHISDTPFGLNDGYHAFLYIAGHTARHTGQIEEIKASPNFPK